MGLFMSNASRLSFLFKSGSLSQLGSFLGSIGIAGSLLLVAYELKQSREIAELQFAYQRMELKQISDQPPREFTEVEWDRLLSKAYREGIEGLSEEEKTYWGITNAKGWDAFALRYETYKRGFLSDAEWANDVFWNEWTYCDDKLWEVNYFQIYDPMFPADFWEMLSEIHQNADCSIFESEEQKE
jgi:hypothetical protein